MAVAKPSDVGVDCYTAADPVKAATIRSVQIHRWKFAILTFTTLLSAATACASSSNAPRAGSSPATQSSSQTAELRVAGDSSAQTGLPDCSQTKVSFISKVPNASQRKLLQCWVHAQVSASLIALKPLTRVGGGAEVLLTSDHDLAFARDAAAGEASARISQNPVDPSMYRVQVSFATGKKAELAMFSTNPSNSTTWRLELGVRDEPEGESAPPAVSQP